MFKMAPKLDQIMTSRIFGLIYFHLLVFGLFSCEFLIGIDAFMSKLTTISFVTEFDHSYVLCQLLWGGEHNEALNYVNENRNTLMAELNASGKLGDH